MLYLQHYAEEEEASRIYPHASRTTTSTSSSGIMREWYSQNLPKLADRKKGVGAELLYPKQSCVRKPNCLISEWRSDAFEIISYNFIF